MPWAKWTVRLRENGLLALGKGADPDIITASAKAYIQRPEPAGVSEKPPDAGSSGAVAAERKGMEQRVVLTGASVICPEPITRYPAFGLFHAVSMVPTISLISCRPVLLEVALDSCNDIQRRAGVDEMGGADLDGRRAGDEKFNGVLGPPDPADADDRDPHRTGHLPHHAQGHGLDGRARQAAGDVGPTAAAGFRCRWPCP